jgi:hypothetical protein
LDDGPFGCFEPLGPGATPSALAALGLGEAESLYRVFFELKGWQPSQVDACEIWELAVMLGVGKPGSGSGVLTGRALLAARVKAAQEGRPPPSISLVPTSVPDPAEEVT